MPAVFATSQAELWAGITGLGFEDLTKDMGAKATSLNVMPLDQVGFKPSSVADVQFFMRSIQDLPILFSDIDIQDSWRDNYAGWLAASGLTLIDRVCTALGQAGGHGQGTEMTKAMTEGHELTDPEITALLAVAGSWKTVEDASTGLVWLPIQNELGKDTSFSRLLTRALQHWGKFAPVKTKKDQGGPRERFHSVMIGAARARGTVISLCMAKHFPQNHVRWPPKVATTVLQACVQFGEAESVFVSNLETAMATLLNVNKKQLAARSTREILRAFQCVMNIWVTVCGERASDSKLGDDGVRVSIQDPFAAVEVIVGIWEESDPDFKSFSNFYHGSDDSAISPLRMVVFPALYRWVLRLWKYQMEGTDPPSDLGKQLQADSLTSDHHSRTLYDLYCQNAARAKSTSKRSGGAAEPESQPAQQHQRQGGAGGGKGSRKGAASQKGKQRQRPNNQGRRGGDRRGGGQQQPTPPPQYWQPQQSSPWQQQQPWPVPFVGMPPPLPPHQPNYQQGSRGQKLCDLCGSASHLRRDCPNARQQDGGGGRGSGKGGGKSGGKGKGKSGGGKGSQIPNPQQMAGQFYQQHAPAISQ